MIYVMWLAIGVFGFLFVGEAAQYWTRAVAKTDAAPKGRHRADSLPEGLGVSPYVLRVRCGYEPMTLAAGSV
jgi:hypothetical protein